MAKINLDALIQREDFEISEATPGSGGKKTSISVVDLVPDAFFFSSLRKPDFQRETTDWDGNKIAEFLESFLSGDLIPAIILWQSPSPHVFIIDGSHRISALKAWIDDDYGDGRTSKLFYDGVIPDDQLEVAQKARNIINKRIGAYSDFKLALSHPDKINSVVVDRAKRVGALAIPLQWVEGDADKAENSFFKINQQAAPINPTELILLKSRKKPNCIAARAIIRSGRGHKYWSNFSPEKQIEIEKLAKEINDVLFAPPLNLPVKTLDVPIAGKIYSAQTLPLVLEFINMVNEVPQDFEVSLDDDSGGDFTVKYLTNARKIAWRINSVHQSSLGLHPIIYFYSQEGRHKLASFAATVAFIMELEKQNSFGAFTKTRSAFEDFLLKYDYLTQQIFRQYRSVLKSYPHIKDFYSAVNNQLAKGSNIDETVEVLLKTYAYNYLTLPANATEVTSGDFTRERKSAVYIKEALQSAARCSICKGYIHVNSITIDHKLRKEDGGSGAVTNGQIAHPYCNSTYKN